jgi:hypothetical protein
MGKTLKLMIRYKKEGGKNLQAYFAGSLAFKLSTEHKAITKRLQFAVS